MAALDTTAFDYALKTRYAQDEIYNLVYDNQPLFGKLPKDENFGGANYVQPVVYTDVAGRSASFAKAQANKGPSNGKKFTVTRVKDYAIASIENEVIKASMGDESAMLSALEEEMERAIHALKRSIGISLFGDGSGTIGTISTISAGVITLSDAEDVTNFEEGMNLVFAANATSALRDSGTSGAVTDVDRDAGTVTIGSTPTGTAASDVIFVEGDYESASDTNKIMGLQGWLPDSAPSSTAFFGVDRTADTVRLGGVRQSGSGLPVDEALVKGMTRACREGGRPDCAFISYDRMEELQNLLQDKVQYVQHKVGDVGFEAMRILTPHGKLDLFADVNARSDAAYLLQLNTWKLKSLGPAPHILDYPGGAGRGVFHEATADGIEIRIGFYGNLCCRAPGWNAVVTNFGS